MRSGGWSCNWVLARCRRHVAVFVTRPVADRRSDHPLFGWTGRPDTTAAEIGVDYIVGESARDQVEGGTWESLESCPTSFRNDADKLRQS